MAAPAVYNVDVNKFRPKKKKTLADMFGGAGEVDPAFGFNPNMEDFDFSEDADIFNRQAEQGEAFRRREEGRATDQVLDSMQSRGILKSGLTGKAIVEQVLGPSFDRATNLAETFGIESAKNQSQLRENARAANRAMNQIQLTGAQKTLLDDYMANNQIDLQNLNGEQEFELQQLIGAQNLEQLQLQAQIEAAKEAAARKRKKKGALGGLAGGVVGGLVEKFIPGASGTFSQFGQSYASGGEA